MFKPNTLVMYKGGGYDGCFWEYNYAYFDKDGTFHNVAATGSMGCDTLEKLKRSYQRQPRDFDLYEFDVEGETARFGREAPISHLIGVAKWIVEHNIDVMIPVKCDTCGTVVEMTKVAGSDPHGIGGIMSEYGKVVCVECACEEDDEYEYGTCHGCGSPLNENGYCLTQGECFYENHTQDQSE